MAPGPDVAILLARGAILRWRFSRPHLNKVQTLVAVRQEGTWRFTAHHRHRDPGRRRDGP